MPIKDDTVQRFEKLLKYQFKKISLLKDALSHKSASPSPKTSHFERLEFLGDRVLNMMISHALFTRFPTESEADLSVRLSKLINRNSLYHVAIFLNLKNYVHFDKTTPSQKKILSDAVEALIGALFLDAGFNTTQTYINEWWQPLLENIHLNTEQDSKSALQVWTQKHYGTKPTYTLLTQTGPAHAPRIEIEVKID